MKSVGVAEFKARLSAYLDEVRRGETVVVCDRRTPVASVVPYDDSVAKIEVDEPRRAGPPPSPPKIALRRRVDLDQLLAQTRGDR